MCSLIHDSTFLAGLLGAIIGGIVAGYFSLKATERAHKNAKEREEENQKKIIKSFIQALNSEIKTLWDIYSRSGGTRLENIQDGEYVNWHLSTTKNYFVIYDNNSHLIGQISVVYHFQFKCFYRSVQQYLLNSTNSL